MTSQAGIVLTGAVESRSRRFRRLMLVAVTSDGTADRFCARRVYGDITSVPAVRPGGTGSHGQGNDGRSLVQLNREGRGVGGQSGLVGAGAIYRCASGFGADDLIRGATHRAADSVAATRVHGHVARVPAVRAQRACGNRDSRRWTSLVQLNCEWGRVCGQTRIVRAGAVE